MVLDKKVVWPGRIVSGIIGMYCAYLLYADKISFGRFVLYMILAVTIVVIIEAMITLAIRKMESRRWNDIRGRFELVFGWPMSANNSYIQAAITDELTRRARRLWGVCEQQAQLAKQPSLDADVTLAEFINLGDIIKDLKRIFWDAHSLAAEAHFGVRGSFKDYLAESKTDV